MGRGGHPTTPPCLPSFPLMAPARSAFAPETRRCRDARLVAGSDWPSGSCGHFSRRCRRHGCRCIWRRTWRQQYRPVCVDGRQAQRALPEAMAGSGGLRGALDTDCDNPIDLILSIRYRLDFARKVIEPGETSELLQCLRGASVHEKAPRMTLADA